MGYPGSHNRNNAQFYFFVCLELQYSLILCVLWKVVIWFEISLFKLNWLCKDFNLQTEASTQRKFNENIFFPMGFCTQNLQNFNKLQNSKCAKSRIVSI